MNYPATGHVTTLDWEDWCDCEHKKALFCIGICFESIRFGICFESIRNAWLVDCEGVLVNAYNEPNTCWLHHWRTLDRHHCYWKVFCGVVRPFVKADQIKNLTALADRTTRQIQSENIMSAVQRLRTPKEQNWTVSPGTQRLQLTVSVASGSRWIITMHTPPALFVCQLARSVRRKQSVTEGCHCSVILVSLCFVP